MRNIAFSGAGLVAVVAVLFFGCGPKPVNKGYSDTVPDELQRLISQNYKDGIYAVGTATGPDEAVAVNKAALQARAEIARIFKSQIDVLQKTYDEQVVDKSSGEYSQVMEVFASLDIGGSQVIKSLINHDVAKEYSAKVLVVVSAEQVKRIFDEKLGSFTSFKASKAYKELEDRADRERKRQERSASE